MSNQFSPFAKLGATSPGAQNAFARVNNPALRIFDRLVEEIKTFEANIGADKECAMRLTSFGNATFQIHEIILNGADIFSFTGKDENGHPILLLQHYTQLSFLLTEKPKSEEVARRIGFRTDFVEPENQSNNQ